MAGASPEDSELWLVTVGPGDTRTMDLDQLDVAFSNGLIDEMTMLCQVGTEDWEPLYVVAGLEPPTRMTAPGAPAPPPESAEHAHLAEAEPYRQRAPTQIGPPTAANIAVDAGREVSLVVNPTAPTASDTPPAFVPAREAAASNPNLRAFKIPAPGAPRANAPGAPRPAGMRVPGPSADAAPRPGGFRVPTPGEPVRPLPRSSAPRPMPGVEATDGRVASAAPPPAAPESSRSNATSPSKIPGPAAFTSSPPGARPSGAPPLPASFSGALAGTAASTRPSGAPALPASFGSMPPAGQLPRPSGAPPLPAAFTAGAAASVPTGSPASPAAFISSPPSAPISTAPISTAPVSSAPKSGAPPLPASFLSTAQPLSAAQPPREPALAALATQPLHESEPRESQLRADDDQDPITAITATNRPSEAPAAAAPSEHPAPEGPPPASSALPVSSKAPPLPPNAFAHLGVNAAPPSSVPGAFAAPSSGVTPAAVGFAAPDFAAADFAAAGETRDDSPFATPKRAAWSRVDKLLLATAAALSLLLILHRNGALHGIAQSVGAGSLYASIEAALGAPSVNTPRGVDKFIESIRSTSPGAGAAPAPGEP